MRSIRHLQSDCKVKRKLSLDLQGYFNPYAVRMPGGWSVARSEGMTTMKARLFGLAVLFGVFATTAAAAATKVAASGCCPCPFCT
jgi:hypothetical protein